jgi:hypothetical protein
MRSILSETALAAALALAIAFTLSCSDDSGGGNAVRKAKISGVSEKGTFVEGSKAYLHELDGSFAKTGRSFFDIIANERGEFEIEDVEIASPYALLEASGQYRNEVTGKITSAPISLFAIADIRDRESVNVNILTHLEYYRVLNLAKNEGKTVAEAKKQAQEEILAVFGIDGSGFANSEDMSILGTGEGDAALLAISVLLQGDLNEGEFSQRLTKFSKSIEETGKWEDEAEKDEMMEWLDPTIWSCESPNGKNAKVCCSSQNGGNVEGCIENIYEKGLRYSSDRIAKHILSWNLSAEVPEFDKYAVDFYLIRKYQLDKCDASNEGEEKIIADMHGAKVACKGGFWKWDWASRT